MGALGSAAGIRTRIRIRRIHIIYVLGPSGSGPGFSSTRYESGSGTFFYNQAKIVRTILIPTVL